MTRKRKGPGSLRAGLLLATLLCWILPVLIVTATAGALLNFNYNRNLRNSVDAGVENAMRQVEIRMLSAIEDSKAVSYDGIVRQAWRDFQRNPDEGFVYRDVTEYLSQKFTRSSSYQAAFISFLEESLDIHAYTCAPGTAKLALFRHYQSQVLPAARDLIHGRDTGIFFLVQDGEVYMVRNLLDSSFIPYALLVIQLEKSDLFQSLYSVADISDPILSIDGVTIPLGNEPEEDSPRDVSITGDADGHTMVFSARILGLNSAISREIVLIAIGFVAALVVPILVLIVWLFHRNLNKPIRELIDANTRVEQGQRGYQITARAPNREFTQLYNHFNTMSGQLESQFDRLYQEQQALQQAKIKALQSQINPHFLNNTLEVINWQARLADNEVVCNMIEALSTMLDAAIGRDGRSQVPVSEELKYVEAYLTITKERLGDRLTIHRQIDPDVLPCFIPLLMLQPIIENAVDYDLSRTSGELCIRAYRTEAFGGSALCFEIEHDGVFNAKDWESVRRSLNAPAADPGEKLRSGSIGIRNVSQRLKLLYGENYRFTIEEMTPGRILAKIILPVSAPNF